MFVGERPEVMNGALLVENLVANEACTGASWRNCAYTNPVALIYTPQPKERMTEALCRQLCRTI